MIISNPLCSCSGPGPALPGLAWPLTPADLLQIDFALEPEKQPKKKRRRDIAERKQSSTLRSSEGLGVGRGGVVKIDGYNDLL